MLTKKEMEATAFELKENFHRLAYSMEHVSNETGLSIAEITDVLEMKHPNPSHVWVVREYLEDMLVKEGIPVYPFSKLADKRVNLWFSYQTPWRN